MTQTFIEATIPGATPAWVPQLIPDGFKVTRKAALMGTHARGAMLVSLGELPCLARPQAPLMIIDEPDDEGALLLQPGDPGYRELQDRLDGTFDPAIAALEADILAEMGEEGVTEARRQGILPPPANSRVAVAVTEDELFRLRELERREQG